MNAKDFAIATRRGVACSVILAGLGVVLAGCYQTTGKGSFPADYRQRHPIAIKEGDQTLEVFIGNTRGGLPAPQRSEIAAFAYRWSKEATGGFIIDQPTGTPNYLAAADTVREIRALLVASGVAPGAINVRPYRPVSPEVLASIKIHYPRISAEAGPCGLWPNDIGPSFDRTYNENQPYYNHGCAVQRNLAAMVERPADLVQPRAAETPIYAQRRTAVFEKYRRGESPQTIYPNPKDGKISNIGQ
jgi:pilus assembly protein CpaD